MKILMIGPLPPPLGGTSVSFNNLIKELETKNLAEIIIVNTGGVRGKGLNAIPAFINKANQIFRKAKVSDIVTLHASTTGIPYIGPLCLAAAKYYKKPFVLRKFGGSDYSETINVFAGIIASSIIKRTNIYLVETKNLVNNYKSKNNNVWVEWFPTHRNQTLINIKEEKHCRKFVYVGHVRKNKGIHVLVDVMRQIKDNDITLDVYGPWFKDIDKTIFDEHENISYKGVIEPEKVIETLQNYDALILPTLAKTEGYPGSIIEAFMAGLPVISTTCGAIPEIVDESVGILVPPDDSLKLKEAMLKLANDKTLFNELRSKAYAKANFFSTESAAKRFVNLCTQCVKAYK